MHSIDTFVDVKICVV